MNAYDWFLKALDLAGNCGELTRDQMKTLGISESDPQPGYYRRRKGKGGPFVTVAIWNTAEAMVALENGEPADPYAIWTFACRHPISEETYHAVMTGDPWPNEPPAAIGHNSVASDDPHDHLAAEYEGEREQAEAFLKEPVTTKDQADRAAIWSKRLAAIAKKATDLHKVDKQPHLDAGRAIDDKWRDLKEGPDLLSKRLKRHMDDYLREQDRIEQERQAKAREEADRLRREADEAARAARSSDNEYEQAKADRLARELADAEREAQARNAQAGRTGAKVSLRTFIAATITDYDALVMALKDRPEVREIIQSLANRAAKSGVELAGMKITEDRRAA